VTAPSLLQELSDRGVHLEEDGDRLVYDAPRGALTDNHRALLVERKPEILRMLRAETFCHALRAAVAMLSEGYTFNGVDPGALEAAQRADAELDAANPAQNLRVALVALRDWERAWAQAGQGGLCRGGGHPPIARMDPMDRGR